MCKLNSDGKVLWASGMGRDREDYFNGLALGLDGGVFVAGRFWGPSNFNPDPDAKTILESAGSFDAYVLSWTRTGHLVWATQLGGPDDDGALDLAAGRDGAFYITGYYHSGNLLLLAPLGAADGFVVKMSLAGNVIVARGFGGPKRHRRLYCSGSRRQALPDR